MEKTIGVVTFLFLIISCGETPPKVVQTIPKEPSPELSEEERCIKYRINTYHRLDNGIVELVFNDTILKAHKALILDEVIEKKFKLKHLSIFDSFFYHKCIMPIMDSVIYSIYGANGKDSLINLGYHLTDSIYKAKIANGELEE